ncbi:MAG: hypothetical protein ACBR12_18450 [Microcoleus sp.]
MLQNYQKGMSVFDDCHNSTVRSQWVALTDEIGAEASCCRIERITLR